MKTYRTFIFLAFLSVSLSIGCEVDAIHPKAPVNPDKDELLKLVNEARSTGCNCGDTYYPPVDVVVWSDQLEQAAQNHSNDMNEHDNLSHTGSDGSLPGDRLNSIGYSWWTYGENIALGYSSEKAAVEGWLDSPGHCANIMNGDMTEMGVATSGSYWTMVLAKPKL